MVLSLYELRSATDEEPHKCISALIFLKRPGLILGNCMIVHGDIQDMHYEPVQSRIIVCHRLMF